MTTTMIANSVEPSREVEKRIMDRVLRDGENVTIVDSPPGAGKTRLVESVVSAAVLHLGLRVAVATPRAEQSFDLLRRLSRNYVPMHIQVLQSKRRFLPHDLEVDPNIQAPVSNPQSLAHRPGVVVGTAAKFLFSMPRIPQSAFDLLIVDEAYQLSAADMNPVVTLANQVLLVGDPGQLAPLVKTDTGRFEAARYRVHRPAPEEMLRLWPRIAREQLPSTFRFPRDTVDYIQPAFYASLPFDSAVTRQQRQLTFHTVGTGSAIDRALDMLADGASLVGILAPEKLVGKGQIDPEVSDIMARVCYRMLQRGAEWVGERQLSGADIGCIDSHVAPGEQLRRRLINLIPENTPMVETPEIWQGLQRPLMVVKHTLSGVRRIDPFALEPGRTCVMLSRHQIGCVLVGRDGVGGALDRYQHDSGARPSGAEDSTWRGWQSQATLWKKLENTGRLIRIN